MSSMEQLLHEVSHSEIKYGIILLRKTDGTKRFFSNLPERFTINLRGIDLLERHLMPKSIWIGFQDMRKFRPGEVLRLTKKDGVVNIH